MPRLLGMESDKLLLWSHSRVSLERLPGFDGVEPVRLFCDRFRMESDDRSPRSAGIEPLNALFEGDYIHKWRSPNI